MMTNLFIMFDPVTNFLSLNWFSCALPLILIMKNYYMALNRLTYLSNNITYFIIKDLKANMKKSQWKLKTLLMTIFSLIYLMNLISLTPFIFTPTSHLSMTMFLSLPVWSSMMIYMIHKNIYILMAHLVPSGTPIILIPFMVMIETISMMIRPLTLMIRLMANMIAGHILICLISKMLYTNINLILFISMLLNMLMLLEMSVAMIQAYVFVMLISLYISETK